MFGNLVIAFIYAFAFAAVVKRLISNPAIRSVFAFSLASFFLIILVGFACEAFLAEPWHRMEVEALWFAVSVIPVVLYFWMARKSAFLPGPEEKKASEERFDKLKDEFLSVASHELRTPLSVINGFAEILVREKLGPLNDEQKRRVRKILMQGQRLNRIIDELLDLSRIRSGKIECRRDVFDLIPVMKAALDDHQIVCEQQDVKLVDALPDVLPDVVGDLERVTQIVVNLLNNAIKYTEPGGCVTMKAGYDKQSHEVRIEVIDTGIGIDPGDQERVFKEFYRAQHHHARKYAGTGLGLTIVKQLVEAQRGRVAVTSEGLGKGSTFLFTLPAASSGTQKASLYIRPLMSEA